MLSKTLSQYSILIPLQHLAGDCCSKRCHSPLLQSTPISVLLSWRLSQRIGGTERGSELSLPEGKNTLLQEFLVWDPFRVFLTQLSYRVEGVTAVRVDLYWDTS